MFIKRIILILIFLKSTIYLVNMSSVSTFKAFVQLLTNMDLDIDIAAPKGRSSSH